MKEPLPSNSDAAAPPSIATVAWPIAFAVAAHVLLLGLPSVNLEWAFSDAARCLERHRPDLLARYFSVQANTLGVPVLSWLLHRAVPAADIALMPRLLSISGFLFLGLAVARLNRLTGKRIDPRLLAAAVFLNPLVWTFGGRGTADFFPAALALYAVSLLWQGGGSRSRTAGASLMLGLAAVLKYHALLLLPLIWIEGGLRGRQGFRRARGLAAISILALIPPALYLFAVKKSLGFWVTPTPHQEMHRLIAEPVSVLANFVAYAGFLVLLLMPFSLSPVWNRVRGPGTLAGALLAEAALFRLGYSHLKPGGEMDLGPLDAFLDERLVAGALCACAPVLLVILKDGLDDYSENSDARRTALACAIGTLLFIAALSFTRPAQRYLAFVLPLLYPFVLRGLEKHKSFTGLALAFHVSINIFLALSQAATGTAAMDITRKIAGGGLIAVTDPGEILGHTGDLFPFDSAAPPKYVVVAGRDPRRLLFSESSPTPFARKAYSVVPLDVPEGREGAQEGIP